MAKLIAHASFFKRKFAGTIFEKHFSNIDDKRKLEIYIVPPHKAKTLKQNNTFWGLVDAIHSAGLSNEDSIEDLRRYFMERAGLIEFEKKDVSPKCRKAITNFAKLLNFDKALQTEVLGLVERVVETKYTSLSLASSKTLALMIDDVIAYYKKCGTNDNKVEEILQGIDY